MKKSRLLSLLAAFAATSFMTACDFGSDDEDSSKPEISGFDAPAFGESVDAWSEGTPVSFKGTVSDDNSVSTIKFQIVDPLTGKVVKDLQTFTINKSSVTFGPDQDLKVSFTNSGDWVSTGNYFIRIVATDNDGLTNSADLNFKSIVGDAANLDIADTTLTLGSNGNANPGFLDADDMSAYNVTAAAAVKEDIDLYYGYSATAGKDRFFTPAQAKASEFNGIKDWSSTATVTLKSATMTAAQFDAITSQTQVDSVFNAATSATGGSVDVAAGTVIALKTSSGNNVLIRVSSVVTGAAGTVTIKGKY